MFRSDLLSGKRILITGGGTGLGAVMALRFAELGARLVLCGRRAEPLAETAARIAQATGAQVDTACCDVREPEAVAAMFEHIWASGPLDALVNNAAATFLAQTERLSHRAVDAVLATTLHGAVYCTLETGRRWIDAGRPGRVLNILSPSVRTGRPFTVPSVIAKAGLQAMMRSLAVEWGPKGVGLVAIAPGPFPTPGATARLRPAQRSGGVGAAQRNPMGRVGSMAELGNLASYLLSDEAAYINGETVAIDGGAQLRTSGAEDLMAWSDADWDALRTSRR